MREISAVEVKGLISVVPESASSLMVVAVEKRRVRCWGDALAFYGRKGKLVDDKLSKGR